MEKKKKFTKRGLKPFFCVLPCILIVVLFNYVPLWGWIYSFFNYKPGWELKNCEFVGLQNFRDLFGNRVMLQNILRVLRNTFGLKFLAYVFSPLPMVVAVLLSEVRSRKFQKTVQRTDPKVDGLGFVAFQQVTFVQLKTFLAGLIVPAEKLVHSKGIGDDRVVGHVAVCQPLAEVF